MWKTLSQSPIRGRESVISHISQKTPKREFLTLTIVSWAITSHCRARQTLQAFPWTVPRYDKGHLYCSTFYRRSIGQLYRIITDYDNMELSGLSDKKLPEGVACVQRWLFTSVLGFLTGTISTAGRFRYAVDCVLPLVTWWSVNIGLAQYPMPITPSPIRWWRFYNVLSHYITSYSIYHATSCY